MEKFKIVVAFLAFLTALGSVDAQELSNFDADELFAIGRREVFEGKKKQGQGKLRYILEKNPAYDEVRIFLAKTYAWDGSYAQARSELQTILKEDSTHRDAANVLIEVELWSRDFDAALSLLQKARRAYPEDEGLLYKEANALTSLGRNKEALMSLNRFLQLHPGHEGGRALYDSIRLQSHKYTAAITVGTESFDRAFDLSYYLSAQLVRRDTWCTSIIRINYANRFNIDGSQLELDLYPKITKTIFAYINYGYSESALFPDNRMGGELFFKLPVKLETSAGFRYMDFGQNTRILIYTGSLGWYFRNYWFSIRSFITPGESKKSVAGAMSARRYFKNPGNYLELNAGFGFSPDQGRLQNSTGLSENAIYLLKSQRVGLSWQYLVHRTWTINLSVYGVRQELAFDQKSYVFIAGSFLSLGKKF